MRKCLLVMLIACSKKAEPTDDCEKFVERSMPILEEQVKKSPKPISIDEAKAKFLDMCKKSHGKEGNKDDGLLTCVNGAADEAAIKACWAESMKGYMKDSKAIEAKLQLRKLHRDLKRTLAEKSAFPIGKVGPTPATPCCASADHKCPVADWKDPVWTALDFQIDEPTQFQYSYASDGKTATLTAVGDTECAGKPVTYSIAVGADGNGTIEEH